MCDAGNRRCYETPAYPAWCESECTDDHHFYWSMSESRLDGMTVEIMVPQQMEIVVGVYEPYDDGIGSGYHRQYSERVPFSDTNERNRLIRQIKDQAHAYVARAQKNARSLQETVS